MTNLALKSLVRLAGIAVTLSAAPCSVRAQQQLNINLTFYQQYDQISPVSKFFGRYTRVYAHLDLNGNIDSTSVDSSCAGHKRCRKSHGTLPNENEIKLGASSAEEWKVVDRDKLINVVDFVSFRRAILVKVNGSNCSAQVDYKLKPGFSDYQYRREDGTLGVARSVVAGGLNCSVF